MRVKLYLVRRWENLVALRFGATEIIKSINRLKGPAASTCCGCGTSYRIPAYDIGASNAIRSARVYKVANEGADRLLDVGGGGGR
jgi:Fe-S oxidoreductase